MSSLLSLKNADLAASLKSLQNEIRDNPSEPKHRIFLFQLLSVLGQWERALGQLNVLRDLHSESLSMVQAYQETLHCEALRSAVFSGQRSPLLFGQPEPWMAVMLESLKMTGQARLAEAAAMREEALNDAPVSSGSLTLFPDKSGDQSAPSANLPFEWIADADSRIGPFLEGIVNGRYFWIPFQRIASIAFEKVTDLRDLVWIPTRFQWANGGEAVGFVPTRYVESETNSDDQVRLGWKTIWNEVGQGTYIGQGQRIFATDVDEYAVTAIHKIEFRHE